MNVEARHPWFRMWLVLVLVAAGLPACGGSGDSSGDVDADLEGMDGDDDIPGDGEATEGGDAEADGVEGDSPTCTSGGECNDSNPCTLDECRGGFCVNTAAPDGTVCDDDTFCMLPGQCLAGVCEGIVENDCDDDNPCTDDACNGDGTCAYTHNTATCDDGVACTIETCNLLLGCLEIPDNTLCSDGVGCTADVCDLTEGCRNTTDDVACDDGNWCSGIEYCDQTLDCRRRETCDHAVGLRAEAFRRASFSLVVRSC